MSIAGIAALEPVSKKITLVELDIGNEQTTWFNWAAGVWYVDFDAVYDLIDASFLMGVEAQTVTAVGSCYSDATPLISVADAATVQTTEMSFYFDSDAHRVYIHLQNGDEPSLHRVVIGVVYGVANHACIHNGVVYEPRLLDAPTIVKQKDPLFFGKIAFDGGWIGIDNTDGEFDQLGETEDVFGNEVRILQGFDDMEYTNYARCATGIMETIRIGPDRLEVLMKDGRKSWSTALPTSTFLTTTYTYLNEFNEGKPIPLVYGTCRHVPCVCINEDEAAPSAYTFVVADTQYHDLHAISKVYVTNEDGKPIPRMPASKDLSAGTFVLASAYYNAGQTVTADVQGYHDASSALIENALDVIMDILTNYQGLDDTAYYFDQAEWAATRVLVPSVGICISKETTVADVIADICSSTNTVIIKKDDGKLTARKYDADRAVAQYFTLSDLLEIPTIEYDPTEVLTSTVVGYSRNWNDGTPKKLRDTSNETTIYEKYKTYREREFDTVLTSKENAQTFSDDIMSLSSSVAKRVRLRMKMQPLEREIMDMIECYVWRQKGSGLLGRCKAEILGITKNLTAAEIILDCRVVEVY